MANQFRNDGEMPQNMANQFPVTGRSWSKRDKGKPKFKRTGPVYMKEPPAYLDFLVALVCFIGVVLVAAAGSDPEPLPGPQLSEVAPTFFFVLGMFFVGNGLDKRGRL